MHFALSTEQEALKESTRDLLESRYGRDWLRAFVDGGDGDLAGMWATLAHGLGVQSIVIDEDLGGAGGDLVDLAVAVQEAGARLLPAPLIHGLVLPVAALGAMSDRQVREALLPGIACGEKVVVVVLPAANDVVTAEREGLVWRLTGLVAAAAGAGLADILLLPATGPEGIRIFRVDVPADGLSIGQVDALDPTRPVGQITFTGAEAVAVGDESDVEAVLDAVRIHGAVALAAEQVGLAGEALRRTAAFTLERYQFGRSIGSFQAVKHRLATMYVDMQSAQLAMLYAARAVSDGAADASLAAETAAALASDVAGRCAAQMIQLHGGIAYTWEHDAQLFYKRAVTSAHLLDAASTRRERIAELLGV